MPAAVTEITARSAFYRFAITAPLSPAVHFLQLGAADFAAPFLISESLRWGYLILGLGDRRVCGNVLGIGVVVIASLRPPPQAARLAVKPVRNPSEIVDRPPSCSRATRRGGPANIAKLPELST